MIDRNLLAPCGLYCGVCGVMIAQRDGNENLRTKLAGFYGCQPQDLVCEGCMSEVRSEFCRVCHIRACCEAKGYEGCHLCADWPCAHIESFPVPVGKKVIMRAIPTWRDLGTEKYVSLEEARYLCPNCGQALFRGTKRCRGCGTMVDLD
jgi:predicted RNA-binding Zn-ribbon protein involved in translation (DUF1610 family)